MELFPELKFGWLNGWLPIALLGLIDGIIFMIFPKEVVRRLWDRSGWSQKQRAFTIAGKLFAFACLALLTFTPLKIGHPIFMVGAILIVLSLIGLVKALYDFMNTTLGEPVTRGLYQISRHPQIVTASLVILGACIVAGSWVAFMLWFIARLFEHYGILAEEEVCLKQYGESYRLYLNRVPRYAVFF